MRKVSHHEHARRNLDKAKHYHEKAQGHLDKAAKESMGMKKPAPKRKKSK